jgi:hypothetical protein
MDHDCLGLVHFPSTLRPPPAAAAAAARPSTPLQSINNGFFGVLEVREGSSANSNSSIIRKDDNFNVKIPMLTLALPPPPPSTIVSSRSDFILSSTKLSRCLLVASASSPVCCCRCSGRPCRCVRQAEDHDCSVCCSPYASRVLSRFLRYKGFHSHAAVLGA